MVTTWWSPQFNALLGSLVVAAGAWLAWDSFSLWGIALVVGAVAGFLLWRGRTIALVWAWATLLIGLESLAWPIVTMVQVRSITAEPTDDQMGTILSAVLTGLFSAIFWITFSYGLFKRIGQPLVAPSPDVPMSDSVVSHVEPPQQNKIAPSASRSDRRRRRT
ncbi:MAG: hypothetical protein Q8L74_08420 [Nitrospirota bacterium]|nr:hypothetical protein [Nitrospirota bacterium]MDP2384078.1 hypothetical protein [Nitrospirota bacterium]MDP3598613.1 hypothetical protein [Nitrospirota bacterium]